MSGSTFPVGLSIVDEDASFSHRTFATANSKRDNVKQHIGLILQFLVLTATPLISWWQLQFGFNLIWMPGLLTLAVVLFLIGTRLRESR